MSRRDAFKHILTSLHDAMLDDARWPATSALIDEACGLTGNALMIGEGPKDDVRVSFVGLYYRGERRLDLGREYLEICHPIDERVPRVRSQPHGRLVHVTKQYTAEELKISLTYNDALRRAQHQNSIAVRVGGWRARTCPGESATPSAREAGRHRSSRCSRGWCLTFGSSSWSARRWCAPRRRARR